MSSFTLVVMFGACFSGPGETTNLERYLAAPIECAVATTLVIEGHATQAECERNGALLTAGKTDTIDAVCLPVGDPNMPAAVAGWSTDLRGE